MVGVTHVVAAQSGDPKKPAQPTLPPVEVTVTRDAARPTLDLPYALSRVVPDSARPALRHISFEEMLLALPGVTVANRNNPTQDPADLHPRIRRTLGIRRPRCSRRA